MSSKARDLLTTSLVGAGIIGVADVRFVYSASTAAAHTYWTQYFDPDYHHSSITAAYAAATIGRNDVILLGPGAHTQPAASASSAAPAIETTGDSIHIVGMGVNSGAPASQIINDSTSSSTSYGPPFIKVTGSYCKWKNVRITFGNAQSSNTCMVEVHGAGNVFENVFFEGPQTTVLADTEGWDTVRVGNVGNYFKDCVFGHMFKTRSVANNHLQFFRSTGAVAARHTTFENCVFESNIDNTSCTMIDVNSEGGGLYGPQYFRGCHIHFRWSDLGGTALAAIRHGTAGVLGILHFDAACSIWGADDVVLGTNGRLGVVWNHGGGTLDTATLGLASVTA